MPEFYAGYKMWKELVTYDMRELWAVGIVDRQVLNSMAQLVHALHVSSQTTARTNNTQGRH